MAYNSYQKHANVKPVRTRLANEFIGRQELLLGPVVLDCELLQPLGSRQSCLESIDPASEVVLRFVEDPFRLQHFQHTLLSVQNFLGEDEIAELFDIQVGLVPFLLQQFGALRL